MISAKKLYFLRILLISCAKKQELVAFLFPETETAATPP
jgi:hypothetical protein